MAVNPAVVLCLSVLVTVAVGFAVTAVVLWFCFIMQALLFYNGLSV